MPSFLSFRFAVIPLAALLAAATGALAAGSPPDSPVFGPITIEGNTTTSSSLIRHELGFAQGDPFDFKELDRSWEHLEDLGWFAFVDIDYDEEIDGEIPIRVTVEEDRTTHYYPIIDYDRRWDILLGARVYDINFGGRGETLSLAATWYRRHGYDLDWKHPWLFGVRGLSCGLALDWESADFVYRDIDFRSWGATGRVRWVFAKPVFAEVAVTAGAFDQRGAVDGLPDPWPADRRNRLTGRGEIGIDSRDTPWYPTRGTYSRLIAAHVGGEGFHDYTSWTGDLRGFVPLPWKHVLALHAWGRRVDAHVPPEDVLWWGGPETIRGYGYATIEGDEGYLLSAEYRWPIFLMTISGDGRVIGLGLHAFFDQGSAWFDGGTDFPRRSWGAGVHIGISNHQFRFEVARTAGGTTSFQFMDAFNF